MDEILNEYKNLVFAIELFDISWIESLGIDGNRTSLKRLINEGKINSESLIREYNKAIKSSKVNWIKIAKDLNLFYKDDLELYNTNELKECIGFYLFPFIHTEFSDLDFNQIEEIIFVESNSNYNDNGWISKVYLDNHIKKKNELYKPYFLQELIYRTRGKYEVKREHENKWTTINKIRIRR